MSARSRLALLFRPTARNVRYRLLRDLIALVVLVAVGVAAVLVLQARRVESGVVRSRLQRAVGSARSELLRLDRSVRQGGSMIRKWGAAGLIDPEDVPRLNALLGPVLDGLPWAFALVVARSDGAEYYLRREARRWLSRSREPGDSSILTWQEWSLEGQPGERWTEENGSDPRSRPWYVEAASGDVEEEVHQVGPYLFFDRTVPGITGSVRWADSEGRPVVGYTNTDGGTILIGVNDDGAVVGIEPDNFENEDRCRLYRKNLIHQHRGAEFASLVGFEVKPVEGKLVVAVECERASRPVFLRADGKESFYIRSGPSAVELSPSEVLEDTDRRR